MSARLDSRLSISIIVSLAAAATAACASVAAGPPMMPPDEASVLHEVASPLRAVDTTPVPVAAAASAQSLIIVNEHLADLRGRDRFVLRDLPMAPASIDPDPEPVDLDLRRMHIVTGETRFVLARAVQHDGHVIIEETPVQPPEIHFFSGHIMGRPETRAFLGLTSEFAYGYVQHDGITQLIAPDPNEPGRILLYNLTELPRGLLRWREHLCNAKTFPMDVPPQALGMGDDGNGDGDDDLPCRRVKMALETDLEFNEDLFDGETASAMAYAATLLAATTEIFSDQINVSFELSFVRIWEDEDPWTGSSTSQQLTQFRNYWNENMDHVERHLAHFLSGRPLGGGVAYLGVVCSETHGYALSANLNGSFPFPLEDNSAQNWDVFVVAHEIGHNLGAPHTHDYCPPLDQCAPEGAHGSCQSTTECITDGTIMSYCHQCEDGMQNIVLAFHSTVRETMLSYLDTVAACYLGCEPPGGKETIVVPDDFETIQAAIEAASAGDEIIVMPGEYHEAINFLGKQITLRSATGPAVTIINASGLNASAVTCAAGEGPEAVLEGFTITGGQGTLVGLFRRGGGMRSFNSSPTIINCIFTGNSADFGGAMDNRFAQPTVIDCTFLGNAATWGGGMLNEVADPSIVDSTFVSNTAENSGGAIFNWVGSSPDARQAEIMQNAANWGGGLFNHGSQATYINVLLTGNTSTTAGGATYDHHGSAASYINVTLADNTSPLGIMVSQNSEPSIVNSIVWGNTYDEDLMHSVGETGFDITYSNVQDGTPPGAGNMSADPLFISAGAGNYRLQSGSPAIDAGNNNALPEDVETDLDGNDRFIDGDGSGEAVVDMGPYEFEPGPAPCLGDLNGDGVVNVQDLLVLIGAWGSCPSTGTCPADFNGDGVVNVQDLLILIGAWGTCPG